MSAFSFELKHTCSHSGARRGVFHTPHGAVQTPFFMPVGTCGTVRGVLPDDLRRSGAEVLLANTYHLSLRPGHEVVSELGGLHALMGWEGPILTDSGGYQVFSLSDSTTVDENGATMRSVVDGSRVRLDPERVMQIQAGLGADIAMAFDHCPADPHDRDSVASATARTHRWLGRCVKEWRESGSEARGQALFGIVQGGTFEDLRAESVQSALEHDLPGHAIGGVSVGEDRESMLRAVALAAPLLPANKPRYLMGVGTPLDFLDAIEQGIDMFDCVTPTRHGRNHQAFTSRGRINLRNLVWRSDGGVLDPECACPACTQFPLGALRHLCHSGEMLGATLISLHNLHYFQSLLREIRKAIELDNLPGLRSKIERAQGKFQSD